MLSPSSAETRRITLDACRRALRQQVGRFLEVRDELFIVNNITVRPKGTSTKEQDWVWDTGESGQDLLVPVREDFYLLHDVNEPDAFYIVPTDFVRGCLEGAHYQWFLDGFEPDELDGSARNTRHLEENTMRRLRKWPVRHFKNAWHLLRTPDDDVEFADVVPSGHSRPALLARGYTECAISTCRLLVKNMERHREAHATGLLDEYGRRRVVVTSGEAVREETSMSATQIPVEWLTTPPEQLGASQIAALKSAGYWWDNLSRWVQNFRSVQVPRAPIKRGDHFPT